MKSHTASKKKKKKKREIHFNFKKYDNKLIILMCTFKKGKNVIENNSFVAQISFFQDATLTLVSRDQPEPHGLCSSNNF